MFQIKTAPRPHWLDPLPGNAPPCSHPFPLYPSPIFRSIYRAGGTYIRLVTMTAPYSPNQDAGWHADILGVKSRMKVNIASTCQHLRPRHNC